MKEYILLGLLSENSKLYSNRKRLCNLEDLGMFWLLYSSWMLLRLEPKQEAKSLLEALKRAFK